MCLLDGVFVGVQAPHWVVHQRLLFASSFSGSGASNHTPPTMGIAAALTGSRPLIRRTLIVDMAIPLPPLNLRRDSMTSARAKRAMSFCLT